MTERSWKCDVCHRDIEDPTLASFEWVAEPERPKFRLCHKVCAPHRYEGHATLDHILRAGPGKLVTLFLHDPSRPNGQPAYQPGDIAAWADVFRRLFSPGYEEVRERLQSEEAKVLFADAWVEHFAGYWEQFRKDLGEE